MMMISTQLRVCKQVDVKGGKRTSGINIYQTQMRQINITKLLYLETKKLQQTEPYHAIYLILHYETEKDHFYY
jgi:hypothetical protein